MKYFILMLLVCIYHLNYDGVSGNLVEKIKCDFKFTDMFFPNMGSMKMGDMMHSALECVATHIECLKRIVVAQNILKVINHYLIVPWNERYHQAYTHMVVYSAEVPLKDDNGEYSYIDLLAIDRLNHECAVVEYKTITESGKTAVDFKTPLAKATKQANGYAAGLKLGRLQNEKCTKVHIYVGLIINRQSVTEFKLYKEV
jgi:hypothetical protein